MPLDREIRAYLDEQAALRLPPIYEMSVAEARRVAVERAPLRYAVLEEIDTVRDIHVPGPAGPITTRVYTPASAEPLPVLVYFHGGGWVTGNLDTHDGLCRSLARRTPCVVAAVDYRLAPEHRFPAAADDAWAVTTWVAAHAGEIGGRGDRLAAGGDSAGGNLAAVMALRALRHEEPALCLHLMICPVTDDDFTRRSYERNADGFGLTRRAMQWFWDHYVPDHTRRRDPDASPLRASDVRGLAPAAVLTCEFDVLLDEGDDYARRLKDAGVPTFHKRYDGLIHGTVVMPSVTPRAWELIEDSAQALREAFWRGPRR